MFHPNPRRRWTPRSNQHDETRRLTESPFPALEATSERVHGNYLDKGAQQFGTFAGVSAAEASRAPTSVQATPAPQVEDVAF